MAPYEANIFNCTQPHAAIWSHMVEYATIYSHIQLHSIILNLIQHHTTICKHKQSYSTIWSLILSYGVWVQPDTTIWLTMKPHEFECNYIQPHANNFENMLYASIGKNINYKIMEPYANVICYRTKLC